MMNLCANAMNSNAKAPNSTAKPMNSIAKPKNSISKVTNSTANGTKSIAKPTNSKTCSKCFGFTHGSRGLVITWCLGSYPCMVTSYKSLSKVGAYIPSSNALDLPTVAGAL